MNSFAARLQAKLDELEFTQETLAKKLGVSRSAVAHYVQGTRHAPVQQIIKIASILKTDPAWLQFGNISTESKSKNFNDPDIDLIPIFNWKEISNNDFKKSGNKNNLHLDYFNSTREACFALQIKGDSMISSSSNSVNFCPGTYVIIDPNKTPEHGKFVLALPNNKKEAILRQYIEEGGNIYLKPLNPQYPLIEFERKIKILGTLIANIALFN